MDNLPVRSAFKALATAVVPRAVLEPVLKRRFFATRSWANRHWGVFESFEAAREFAAQRGEKTSFSLDHRKWLEEHLALMPHDYPMLYWLTRILDGQPMRIVDVGGSVGVSYLAFERVMTFPQGLRWEVCELPEVVELGRQIAQERGAEQLSFASDLKALDGADILFAAGALQYIETPLHEILGGLHNPPRHVLINRLPLTGRRSTFVTLQHGGITIQAYRIANHHGFVKAMQDTGYHLCDHWKCLENQTCIPLHPELTLEHFHGFYFDRDRA